MTCFILHTKENQRNSFQCLNEPINEAYWTYFLTSRIIQSVSLYISAGSSQLINCCVQTLRPKFLSIKAKERVRLGENIKFLQALYIKNTCVDLEYWLLRNVEILNVSDPDNMPNSFDVLKLLEMWCQGESNLQEMTYSMAVTNGYAEEEEGEQEDVTAPNKGTPKYQQRKSNEPFRRVTLSKDSLPDKFKDNSFDGSHDRWGVKAHETLSRVQGKGFRHEKTKKKKGSYGGGPISMQVNSIKFSDSE